MHILFLIDTFSSKSNNKKSFQLLWGAFFKWIKIKGKTLDCLFYKCNYQSVSCLLTKCLERCNFQCLWTDLIIPCESYIRVKNLGCLFIESVQRTKPAERYCPLQTSTLSLLGFPRRLESLGNSLQSLSSLQSKTSSTTALQIYSDLWYIRDHLMI